MKLLIVIFSLSFFSSAQAIPVLECPQGSTMVKSCQIAREPGDEARAAYVLSLYNQVALCKTGDAFTLLFSSPIKEVEDKTYSETATKTQYDDSVAYIVPGFYLDTQTLLVEFSSGPKAGKSVLAFMRGNAASVVDLNCK